MENQLEVVSIRLVKDAPIISEKRITSPLEAVEVLGDIMSSLDREVFCVVNLKSDGTPINCNFVSAGTINETLAHPREILKSSILSNAAQMIMIHNHPSGRLLPSDDDKSVTRRMMKICNMIGINLVDHIIVGGENQEYYSLLENDVVDFKFKKKKRDDEGVEFPCFAAESTPSISPRR